MKFYERYKASATRRPHLILVLFEREKHEVIRIMFPKLSYSRSFSIYTLKDAREDSHKGCRNEFNAVLRYYIPVHYPATQSIFPKSVLNKVHTEAF
jgi:hypothetical protein